jgi:hypothetical protein
MKFYENVSMGSCADTRGETDERKDRYDETNTRF